MPAMKPRTIARRLLVVLALVAAPLVVFHPIVFSGYTFSQSELNPIIEPRSGGATSLTVIDPAASADQDEPWLAFIAENLAQGQITLVDLKNGLGAPFLESLQPGALYLLNPLLLLFDTHSPGFFDAFVILHVLILVAGMYRLFRAYSRPSIALAMAVMVGLSGVTFEHLNMVNYRGFVWLPWMLEPALRMARGLGSRASVLQLLLANVASLTAGNPQDFLLSLGTVCAGFAIECWAWRQAAVPVRRRVGTFALTVAAALMIGSPAVLPYVVARADLDLVTAVNPERSVTGMHLDWFLPLVVPNMHGICPDLLRAGPYDHWLSGFTTVGAFLVLAACVAVAGRGSWSGAPERRTALLGWLVFLALALLKIHHVFLFDFLQRVPFVCEVAFTKYHLFVFAPLGIAGSLALEVFARADAPARRRILARACALAVGLGVLIALRVWLSSDWSIPASIDPLTVRKLAIEHSTSLAVLVLSLLLLRFLKERALWLLVPLFLAQATLLRPDGYPRRLMRYYRMPEASDAARVRELCAAPFSDAEWDRGVRTQGDEAAFFVQYPGDLRAIHAGTKLRLAAAGVREVERVIAGQVWLSGPPLDPVQDGCPHPIDVVSEEDVAPPILEPGSRILTSLQANQNLFTGVESVCVFNPILNRRFAELFTDWFPVFERNCDLQVEPEPAGLTAGNLHALRFLGVRAIYGYDVAIEAGVTRVRDHVYQIEGALPRMFLLSDEDWRAIESNWRKIPLRKSVSALRDAIGKRALPVTIGTRRIAFQLPESFHGHLVANQAFSRAWTFEGREGEPFCSLFPSWKVDHDGGATAREIVYWPRGLTRALWLAGAGLLVGIVALLLGRRARVR